MLLHLRSSIVTKDLTDRLASIEGRMKNLYRFWQVHAPHFTDHGDTHCKAVERNLDELIPEPVKNQLNEYEIFLLLSSVYVHDVGIMCATTKEEEKEKIRKHHHERSKQFIIDNMNDIFTVSEAFVVANISYAHRDNVQIRDIEKIKTIRHKILGNVNVRMRFLVGLLRLADACDLSHTRTVQDLTTISKLSEEACFHHALHERVSGISFDTKRNTIWLDFNVSSKKEEDICQEFLSKKLQKSLNTVKDTLFANGVSYIDVVPRFSEVGSSMTKLEVPKKKKDSPLSILAVAKKEIEIYEMEEKASSLYAAKKFKESLKWCAKILRKDNKRAWIWLLKGRINADLGRLKEACKCFDTCVKLDESFAHEAGHFYGEVMLEIRKSFELFEKAYQQKPDDVLAILNYAEALTTIGEFTKGYNLATRAWHQTNHIGRIFDAWVIRIIALFLKGNKQESIEEIKGLINFFTTTPEPLSEKTEWVYSKISKCVNESLIKKDEKDLLVSLTCLAERKVSVDYVEDKLLKYLKKNNRK